MGLHKPDMLSILHSLAVHTANTLYLPEKISLLATQDELKLDGELYRLCHSHCHHVSSQVS